MIKTKRRAKGEGKRAEERLSKVCSYFGGLGNVKGKRID